MSDTTSPSIVPKDRVKALRRVRAGDYADALIARELPDGSLEIIDGHLRAETTPDVEVPVLVTDLTAEEADKLLASLDPLAAMAEANSEKLASLLASIETESEALKSMFDQLAKDHVAPKEEVHEDEVPEPPADPITKPGDLWLLGDHRLLCGDSTKAEDVGRLMGGEKADLCFTSPPYGQQRDYDAKQGAGDWDALMIGVFGNLPMSDAGQVLVNLGLIHRDGEWVPYWESWIAWMRDQGWRRFGWYVWDQGSGLPGDWNGRLAPSHEFIFHFNRQAVQPQKHVLCNLERAEREKAKVERGIEKTGLRHKDGTTRKTTSPESIGQTHKIPDSVWRFERHMANDIARLNHPATYPVSLPLHAMQSWIGSVYDPFLGSGTTLIAAEQLDRRCFGMEISPAYCDVIVTRWENLTGKKAVRVNE